MWFAWSCLALAAVTNATANSLAKVAGTRPAGARSPVNLAFLVSSALFGTGLLFYAQSLARLPIAIAYPALVGTVMAAVSLIALFRFKERVSPAQLCGIALVLAGLVLLTTEASHG